MKYQKCLETLYNMNRFSKFKYNLEEIKKLAKLVGNPEKKFLSVHVTGTNGKGSVTHMTSELLKSIFHKKTDTKLGNLLLPI